MLAAEDDRRGLRHRIRHVRREQAAITALRTLEAALRAAIGTTPAPADGAPSTTRNALATRLTAISKELIAAQLVLTAQWAKTQTSAGATALRTSQERLDLGREQLHSARSALRKLTGTVPPWPATVQAPLRTALGHALAARQTLDTVVPLTRAEIALLVPRVTAELAAVDAEITALETEVARAPRPAGATRATIEAELAAVRAEAVRYGWTAGLRNEEAAWLGLLARFLARERLTAAKTLAAQRRSSLTAAKTTLDTIPADGAPTAAQRKSVLSQLIAAVSLSDLAADVATGFVEAERAVAAPQLPTSAWIALLTGRKHRAEIAAVGVQVGATRSAIEGRARAAQRAVPAAVNTHLTAAEAHLAAATTAAAGLPADLRVDVQTADTIQWELTQARHDAADALREFDRALPPTAAQLRSRLTEVTAVVDEAQAQLGRADSHITTALPVTAGQTWETAARALEAARHQLDLHGTSPHRELLEATRHAEFSSHAARDYLTWARSHFLAAARGYLARADKALDAVPASAATTPQSAALVASVTADLLAAEQYRASVRNRIRHARRADVLVGVIRARETLLRTAASTAPPDTDGTVPPARNALATRLAAIGTDLIAVQLVLTPQRAKAATPDSATTMPIQKTQGQIWRGREQLLLARAALWKLTGTVPRWPATVQTPLRTAHGHALTARQTIDTVLPLTRAELAAWVTRATTALDFTDAEIKALEAEIKRAPQATETSRTTIEARLAAVRAEAKRSGWTTILRNEETAWLGQLARILARERLAAAKALAALRRSTQLVAAQTALDAIPEDAVPTAAQRKAVLDPAAVAAGLSDLLADVAPGFAQAEIATAAPAPPAICAATTPVRFYATDFKGSVVLTLDENARPCKLRSFEPFGTEQAATAPTPGTTANDADDLRYLGARRDPTGFYHLGARYYDASFGRFLQTDPLVGDPQNPQDYNRYAYARNNPVRYFDPTGLASQFVNDESWWSESFSAANIRYALGKGAGRTIATVFPAYTPVTYLSDSFRERSGIADFEYGVGQAIIGSTPYVGDLVEGYELVRPDATTLERTIAGGSLLLNARFGGLPPNATPWLRAARSFVAAGTKLGNTFRDAGRALGSWWRGGAEQLPRVRVSRGRFPESAQHIDDATTAGHPRTLTIDRAGAAARRREALRGTRGSPGLDRDEFPPALFREGGEGASVRPIRPGDNRGAGACIGAQCRGLPDGTEILLETVD